MVNEKTYTAEYQGSGTFIISKPKRKSGKLRQSRLKKPRRGVLGSNFPPDQKIKLRPPRSARGVWIKSTR